MKNRNSVWMLFALFSLVFFGCPDDSVTPPDGTVSGTVKDALTEASISAVSVEIVGTNYNWCL